MRLAIHVRPLLDSLRLPLCDDLTKWTSFLTSQVPRALRIPLSRRATTGPSVHMLDNIPPRLGPSWTRHEVHATIYNMGAVPANTERTQEGSCIPRVNSHKVPMTTNEESSSEDKDYNHEDPYPVPTIGDGNRMAADTIRGRPATYTHQGPQNGQNLLPILKGFILNIHPTHIPSCLINNKGEEIVAKYVQLFLNHEDPYTYAKNDIHWSHIHWKDSCSSRH